MNTKQLHKEPKMRESADVTYLGRSVDDLIWTFMEDNQIPGMTLAIVQAPYIPRVIGYGMSDAAQRRLASANTMWPIGPISQAFAAVAVMQLFEQEKIDIHASIGTWLSDIPDAWKPISVLMLMRHSSGIPDYRSVPLWNRDHENHFAELISPLTREPLHFTPGTAVEQSATNFLLLAELVDRVSGMRYEEFVRKYQIRYLDLRRTGFAEDLDSFAAENVAETDNVHQKFKANYHYIDPTEQARSYDEDGVPFARIKQGELRGFSDMFASAQDISFWDIGLAGSVLIHNAENRALLYKPWVMDNGEVVPEVAGWQFYHHRGLLDIKGSVPGYSCFLSRFTHSEELVCVTLLANRENVDLTNLARSIAGAFGDMLSTNYDDNRLFLLESQFSAAKTGARLKEALKHRNIPLFAEFDHAKNAAEAGMVLRPTTVFAFGSPKIGTGLMQMDQSISLVLPLRIGVWEDEAGSTWIAFPKMDQIAADYELGDNKTLIAMQKLEEELVKEAANIY